MSFVNQLVIITTIITIALSVLVGIFSLYRNPRSKAVILWFLTTLSITIWGIGYLLTLTAPNNEMASQYVKIVYLGATLAPILSFHFLATFVFRSIQLKPLIILGYILALVLIFLTSATNLIISGARYMENFGRYEEVTAAGFRVYLAYFVFYVAAGVLILLQAYLKSDGTYKRKIKYLLLASLFGFIGSMSNFLTDLTGIYPYGQLFVWIYPLLVTWGIFFDKLKIEFQ